MRKRRSKLITKRQEEVLHIMAKETTAENDNELVYEKGGGWWLNLEKIHGRTAKALLQLVLIRAESEMGFGLERYAINSCGRKIIKDPDYEPMMIRYIKTGENQYG